jgi:hypothetical protein
MEQNDPILRLARQIDATRRAEHFLVNADSVATVRRQGACDLHRICAEFVTALNTRLSETQLELSPGTYTPEMFRESGANLIQIGSHGREMQFVFQATSQLVSTEKFLIPHILEGEVRAYNQKMLERSEIRSYLLFFCVEKDTAVWRYYDWRTLRTGPVGRELLVSLMEPLF